MSSDSLSTPLKRASLLAFGMLALVMPVSQALAGPDAERIHQRALRYFSPLPESMPGAENDTEARVQLGQMLFFDPRLSANDTQSCASCHLLGEGQFGMDNLAVSPGAFGDVGTRNSPTVLNAGYQASQFWDGRAHDLADQAGQPILNPIEMAMPGEQAVLDKLSGIEAYPAAFAAAFPGDATPLTYSNLAEALAAFQRTLRSPSRFDDFLEGDLAALNEQELRGLDGFIRHNCVRCHDGPLLGGATFEKLGIYGAYPNQEDQGRFEVTGDEADRMVFKTTQLRNVAKTGPWYHDGAVDTLEEAVRIMAELQLRRRISDEDIADMTVFLGALTDHSRE